jgi:hypothetical protein
MAENDSSWRSLSKGISSQASLSSHRKIYLENSVDGIEYSGEKIQAFALQKILKDLKSLA